MQVELLSLTQRNLALTEDSVAGYGDLSTIFAGRSTYAEAIMEFAGRICYRSTQRMGTAPEFIAARVREGHEDIIEHAVVTLRIRNSVEPLYWRTLNRHCEVTDIGANTWVVSGNTLSWKMDMTVPMPMTLDCTATVDGDSITGEVKAGAFGSMPVSGTRKA